MTSPLPRLGTRLSYDSARAGALTALIAFTALAAGWISVNHRRDAVIALAIPILLILIRSPQLSAALGVALLPFSKSINGDNGHAIAPSDILLTLAMIEPLLLLLAGQSRALARAKALRPIALPLGFYAGLVLLNLIEHPTSDVFIGILQRVELIGFPLVLGTVILEPVALRRALRGFVVSATVLAVATIANHNADSALGVQKNPAGGFMACALLLLLTQKWGRKQALALSPFLIVGLVLGQSRGALVGLVLAVGVVVLSSGASGRALRGRLFLLLIGLVVSLSSAPAAIQHRLTHATAASDYALQIRDEYKVDARHLISANPLEGVGINQYLAGNATDGTETSDPHQVLYAEAGMGGYPLAAGFVILVGGSMFALVRRRKTHPLAVAGLVVQVATLGHAFADIYWVRGTPVLGWVLTASGLAIEGEGEEQTMADHLALRTGRNQQPTAVLSQV